MNQRNGTRKGHKHRVVLLCGRGDDDVDLPLEQIDARSGYTDTVFHPYAIACEFSSDGPE